MKAPPIIGILLLAFIGGGCAQTGALSDSNRYAYRAEHSASTKSPLQLASLFQGRLGVVATPIATRPAAEDEPGAVASVDFTLGNTHLLQANLGRTAVTLPVEAAGEHDYRLNVVRETDHYRFLVWALTADGTKSHLMASIDSKPGAGGFWSIGQIYDVGSGWSPHMNSAESSRSTPVPYPAAHPLK